MDGPNEGTSSPGAAGCSRPPAGRYGGPGPGLLRSLVEEWRDVFRGEGGEELVGGDAVEVGEGAATHRFPVSPGCSPAPFPSIPDCAVRPARENRWTDRHTELSRDHSIP